MEQDGPEGPASVAYARQSLQKNEKFGHFSAEIFAQVSIENHLIVTTCIKSLC
jgi:hypothetical protein